MVLFGSPMPNAYEVVIGLEVHLQLLTQSKMFCACRNLYGAEPNSLTCPVCLGLPGALPVLNAEAVRMGIQLGLAVGAHINRSSDFYRKQYFYPDLPKGYQITQGPVALVENGWMDIPGDPAVRGSCAPVPVSIVRAHLEEDAGKSSHEWSEEFSYIEYNRSGVPLLEIVGGPDLRSPQEAYDYLVQLKSLVTFLGICDGNMEEGSLRCDANVSVRRKGETAFGTRVEVKNLNSFRFVKLALDYEIQRQIALLESGTPFEQETRGWDAEKGETRSQRTKEAAMDYRYFPEPDLPPLELDPDEIEQLKVTLPELPKVRHRRFMEDLGLSEDEASTLLQSKAFADYFEEVHRISALPKPTANWMLGEVSRTLNERNTTIEHLKLRPEQLGELIRLVDQGIVNHTTAKERIFPLLLSGKESPTAVVESLGLAQLNDRSRLEALVDQVLETHPGPLEEFRSGKTKLFGFFVGQVMKAAQGQANAPMVNEILKEKLS